MGSGSGSAADLETVGLTVRTVPIADPGDLAGQLPGSGALAWIHGGEGLIGWGEVARVTLPAGQDRFTAADKWLREALDGARIDDEVGAPGCGPVAFGSFTFDPASDGSVLVLPRLVLGRRDGQAWVTTISAQPARGGWPPLGAKRRSGGSGGSSPLYRGGWPPLGAERRSGGSGGSFPLYRGGWPPLGAERRSGGSGGSSPRTDTAPVPGEIRWHDGSLTAPEWERVVAAAVQRIRGGGLHKVVLARDLYASAAAPIDERLLLRRLAARYPECYTFACAGLTGATPELLIKRQGPEVSSLVLAGTFPRGQDAAEDAALGAALLASAKETEEHEYAAASVRDSLAPLCDQLTVAERPVLLKVANLQHLATTVHGTLSARDASGAGHSVLTLLNALHPSAAVCGTPTEAAMELIRELEGMDRGRYAGPVGWVDSAGNGEWGIALRCAEIDGPRARLFAGGGIVADSDPAAELAETVTKFRTMRFALEA